MTAYCWFIRGERHAAMARVSIESVRKADPGFRCIVVTDDAGETGLEDTVPVLHIEPGLPIMLANLEAQVHARLHACYTYESIAFLDTDTLVLEPLEPLADLTITWRDHVRTDEEGAKIEGIAQEMPYNYGVVIARDTQATAEVLIW